MDNINTSFAFFPFSSPSRALDLPSQTYLMMRRSSTEEMACGRTRTKTKPCSQKSQKRIWRPSVIGKRPFSRLRSVTFSHYGPLTWQSRFLGLCIAPHGERNVDLHCSCWSITKSGRDYQVFLKKEISGRRKNEKSI